MDPATNHPASLLDGTLSATALRYTSSPRASIASRADRGWIGEEIEGGSAYRLSKSLIEERELRSSLESEVKGLREALGTMANQVQVLVQRAAGETPEQQAVRAADEALGSLARLREISNASAAAAAERKEEASRFYGSDVAEPAQDGAAPDEPADL